MTHIRRPNRRPLNSLRDAALGERCPKIDKLRFLDERSARQAANEVAHGEKAASETVAVWQCRHCGDWHIGHRP